MTWAPDYVTRAELKDYLNIQNNASDAFIDIWITTVSGNVNDHCGRQFGKVTAEERYYTPKYYRHQGYWFADVDDLQDTTGMAVTDENGTAVTDYVLLPRNNAMKGLPYDRLRLSACTGELTIEAPWGWNAVPSAVKSGVFLQGARLNGRRTSPFGISGSPTEQGEIRLLAQLDPDFKTSLKPFRRGIWRAA